MFKTLTISWYDSKILISICDWFSNTPNFGWQGIVCFITNENMPHYAIVILVHTLNKIFDRLTPSMRFYTILEFRKNWVNGITWQRLEYDITSVTTSIKDAIDVFWYILLKFYTATKWRHYSCIKIYGSLGYNIHVCHLLLDIIFIMKVGYMLGYS